jgi:multiple sugar transport system ATP-binding protein
MNFLNGRVEEGRFVLEDGQKLPLPAGVADISEKVIYGVRPEHLTISDVGLPLTVTVVEPTGSETQIIARHGNQTIVCIFRDRVLPKVGETITVAPDLSRVHLFSESTGRRLS